MMDRARLDFLLGIRRRKDREGMGAMAVVECVS